MPATHDTGKTNCGETRPDRLLSYCTVTLVVRTGSRIVMSVLRYFGVAVLLNLPEKKEVNVFFAKAAPDPSITVRGALAWSFQS